LRVKLPSLPLTIAALGGLLVTLVFCDAVAAKSGERYFIEFRARASTHIGHTYVVYFRMSADVRPIERHYAGLIPEEDGWKGLLAPIRASIRKYKDDTRLPPTAIYRRQLTAAEFLRVARTVRVLKAHARQWHVIFFNCNDFAIEIAEVLGLRRPPSLMPPDVWVIGLRALNEN
jgi:hypothetical protein